MKGKFHIIVQNKRLRFEFDIKRNITVIRGDSATGKTTLVQLISLAAEQGISSGIEVICAKQCRTLPGTDWKLILSGLHENIIFLDENSSYIKTQDFAECVRHSDNYFVLVTREDLPNLPYSVNEIYGIHCSGKYMDLKRTYNQFYRIYNLQLSEKELQPETVVTEDSGSGYDFFHAVCAESGTKCYFAGGKSKLRRSLEQAEGEEVLGIGDGAAIGPEMNELYLLMRQRKNIRLYLPESFEWLILKSGLIDGKKIKDILQHPEDFADSEKFFSWEQFFEKILIDQTKGTYLKYTKKELNEVYIHDKEKRAILEAMRPVSFKERAEK